MREFLKSDDIILNSASEALNLANRLRAYASICEHFVERDELIKTATWFTFATAWLHKVLVVKDFDSKLWSAIGALVDNKCNVRVHGINFASAVCSVLVDGRYRFEIEVCLFAIETHRSDEWKHGATVGEVEGGDGLWVPESGSVG